MAKTKSYTVEVNALDTLVFQVDVSKAQYEKALKNLQKQHEASKDTEESTFRTRYDQTVNVFPTYDYCEDLFRLPSSDIKLIKRTCHPGFRFAK